MIILVVSSVCALLAIGPAMLFARNWRLYRRPGDPPPGAPLPSISILVPARNEERSIGAAVRAALASADAAVEVIVLDDHSTDRTAEIVESIGREDGRVRLVRAPALPAGWCGKQHACHVLSALATYEVLAFIDADVRLAPDGLARAAAFMELSGADLVSGIPHQETGTFLEKLLIPLIHFVLLGYLPIDRMRASTHPAYGAGCGQFFLARRAAYLRAGGHAAICASLHDGITLPRAFRSAGLRTDLFDATDVASCRMYYGAQQVWRGLEKNAIEGMAAPKSIVLWTIILLGGQVVPWILAGIALSQLRVMTPMIEASLAMSIAAILASLAVRTASAARFGHTWIGAVLHPLGIFGLTLIQYSALLRQIIGRPSQWKGRACPA